MATDKIKILPKPKYGVGRKANRKTVLVLFGTRPEVIKLASVIQQLEQRRDEIRTFNVASGQHKELLYPFVDMFGIRVDEDLRLMTSNQDPSELCDRIFAALDPIVQRESPDLIIVQGDTTTALAGALLGRHRGIRVAHVEAGLRSGNLLSPYPEEMNRRFITQLATFHFAATPRNRETLLSEGVNDDSIFVTGNPVVDALQMIRDGDEGLAAAKLLKVIGARKCIVLTTHRRESFGEAIQANLRVLTKFVDEHEDLVLVFPIHPNPNVQLPAKKVCGGHPRIVLTEPLDYRNFIQVLSSSWLIVSDSGGVQEEVPSLGKPLLILRENTERCECIDTGMAKLVGGRPETLMSMLEEAYQTDSWVNRLSKVQNPFGTGDSGEQIVEHIGSLLNSAPMRVAKWKGKKGGTVSNLVSDSAQSTGRKEITIVVPCFNEELALANLHVRLLAVKESLARVYSVSTILVDDGSTDQTWELMQTYFGNDPDCVLLQQPQNLGLAAAILRGIRTAKTEVVCSIDSDCTYDPEELHKLLPLLTADVDLVTGSPYHPLGEVRDVPQWRLALSKTASSLYRRVLKHKLYTYTSCFRVYRRSAILSLDLRQNGFLGIAELLGKLELQGSKIVECPSTLGVRVQGVSKMRTARVIVGHIFLLGRLLAHRGHQKLFG